MRKMRVSEKPYKGVTVFFLGASGRQTMPVCKGFYELGCTVITFCKSRVETGYLTRYCSKRLLYENEKRDGEDFLCCGSRLIRENRYSLVVPLGDTSAEYLSRHKEELEHYSKIAVNTWDVFQYAHNKAETMRICQERNISAPRTLFSADPVREMKNGALTFPVVVKPKVGLGSVGFQILRSMEALEKYMESYDNANGELLVQEYVEQGDQPQYRADLFRDRDGIFRAVTVGCVTRWFPLDGGSGIFAYSIHDEEIAEMCKRLLDAIDWNGYANIDMVWDVRENRAKILEINGRTGATIKLDYLAGINMSRLILENELGYPVSSMLSYKDGCRLTCLLPDLLWFLKSKNRFHAHPSWFDRRGVRDAVFSWDDPLPAFGFLIISLKNFSRSMKKRKRFALPAENN